MELLTFPITVRREGRAYNEDFPGVYGIGKAIDEAKTSLLEAMRIYIHECRALHQPVPRACTVYTETVSIAV